MNKIKRFDAKLIKFFTAQLIIALEYIHEDLGSTFKDLKPDNIMLDEFGHIKLTEFCLRESNFNYCNSFIADVLKVDRIDKLCYLAPEILRGKRNIVIILIKQGKKLIIESIFGLSVV